MGLRALCTQLPEAPSNSVRDLGAGVHASANSAGSRRVVISWPARVMILTATVSGGSGGGKGWERSPVSAARALGSSCLPSAFWRGLKYLRGFLAAGA